MKPFSSIYTLGLLYEVSSFILTRNKTENDSK